MPQASNPYLPLVVAAAQQQGIDPQWAAATLLTEDAPGDPNATSPQGATGLMQVMPGNAAGANLLNPAQNIQRGVQILAANLKATGGNKSEASAMYFGGPNPSQWGPRTHGYVQKVADNYNALGAPMSSVPAPQQQSPGAMPNLSAFLSQQSTPQTPAAAAPQGDAMPNLNAFLNTGAPPPGPPATRGQSGYTGGSAVQNGFNAGVNRITGAAIGGAEDAFEATPSVLTPKAAGAINGVAPGLGTAVNNLISLPVKGAGALFGGAQGAVAQTGAELGAPALGRDLAALPEAFAGDATASSPAQEIVTPPTQVEDLTSLINKIGPDTPLSWRAERRQAATPQPAAPAPSEATALQAQLTRGPIKGDATIYVPGSNPTAAEIAGDPVVSLEQKHYAQNVDPASFKAQQDANNAARVNLYQGLAGSPDDIQIAEEARDAQAAKDLTAAFANKGVADAEPVVGTIDRILAGPAGKDDAVVSTLNSIKGKLYGPNGQLETDPEMLYGVRQAINNLLSKKGALANPQAQLATSQLMQVKGALDQAIEPAAPGFAQYLQNYSAASRPIDTMQYLQDKMPAVIGANGTMSQPKFHQMMVQIAKARQLPGVNPAKSIDPETLSGLTALHSDLTRTTNLDLGKARGSDTVQNVNIPAMLAGQAGRQVGSLAAHGVASLLHPGLGNMAVEGAKAVAGSVKSAATRKAQAARIRYLLNPTGEPPTE